MPINNHILGIFSTVNTTVFDFERRILCHLAKIKTTQLGEEVIKPKLNINLINLKNVDHHMTCTLKSRNSLS